DPTIWVVILDEFLQNLNIWHVRVLLDSYATIEMHQTDRVLRQLGFRQSIPWHLRCSMMSTKLTYGDRICIGHYSTRNISKYGKIGTIIYLLTNRLSFWS
ncbi:hypothetical protein Golax_005235, partial [Gossypium laxum]|nr:hypothetical protein [Gossypium laxum]